jgi:hypothetical protein
VLERTEEEFSQLLLSPDRAAASAAAFFVQADGVRE